jgi:predicted CopG family antitoxin
MVEIDYLAYRERKRTQYKCISVPVSVYNKLNELGHINDSFGDVIERLIEANKLHTMAVPKLDDE